MFVLFVVLFALYDFDESGMLTLDEMVLSFRSALSGSCKICQVDPPLERDIEATVSLCFETAKDAHTRPTSTSESLTFSGIDRETFVTFCLATPDVCSWIEYFDDLLEYDVANAYKRFIEIIPDPLSSWPNPNEEDEAYFNAILGGMTKQSLERTARPRGVKSWRNVLPFLNTNNPYKSSQARPVKNLQIDWVYGYNSKHTIQNVHYSGKGDIVYPAGCFAILQNVSKNEQRHFTTHNDMIGAMTLYSTEEGETVIATGDRGFRPTILVWDGETGAVLAQMSGFHRRGIRRLDFSPDHTLLVSLGLDPYHSLAVYKWRTSEKIWSSRTTSYPVYDVRFLTNDLFVSVGFQHIYFWKAHQKQFFKRYRGQTTNISTNPTAPLASEGSSFALEKNYLCVGNIQDVVYAGSESGYLSVWEGRNCIRQIKAHTGAIMTTNKISDTGMMTACNSGKILLWNKEFEILSTFNINALGCIQSTIISINYHSLASKVLIGLETSEIYEIDATDGRNLHAGALVVGHFEPQITGVTCHPYQANSFVTVGRDKTLRIFDAQDKRQSKMVSLQEVANCVEYHPNGITLVLGMGDASAENTPAAPRLPNTNKDGSYLLVNSEDLTVLHEARDTKMLITCLAMSADQTKFALGCADNNIYLYVMKNSQANCYSICRGHSSPILQLDFAVGQPYLMSNSTTGELFFWDLGTGQVQHPKQMKNVKWETNRCIYSFATQSFWTPDKDEVETSFVYTQACKSHSEDIIYIADNKGGLTVSNFPCFLQEAPVYLKYQTHGLQGISRCAISCQDEMLFTVGAHDGCIVQWKVSPMEITTITDPKRFDPFSANNITPYSINPYAALLKELQFDGKSLDQTAKCEAMISNDISAIQDFEEEKVEKKSMMPWQKTIVSPSQVLVEDNTEPSDRLELEFVHGFTVDTTRKAMCYLPQLANSAESTSTSNASANLTTIGQEIVFFAGNVVVLMKVLTRKQRFFTQHNSKITAVAVNPVLPVVASGDLGTAPRILIWDSSTLFTSHRLQGFHKRGIGSLQFSADGRILLTSGLDSLHSIALYDWKNETMLAYTGTSLTKPLALEYSPDCSSILQVGQDIIRQWKLVGRNFVSQDILLTTRAKLQAFMSIAWIGSNPVVGTAEGSIYRILGIRLESIIQAHTGPINCLLSTPDGIISASTDGLVKIWTRFLECRLIIELKSLQAIGSHIRGLDYQPQSGRILIGTLNSEIFEVTASDGENCHKGPLLEGHGGGGELWGLSMNPLTEEYCTVGDDCILRIWNISTHRSMFTVALEMPGRCCAYSPDGKHIAVGLGGPNKAVERQFDGKWIVIDTSDYQVSHEARDSNQWLREIKYSPNGTYIVIGGEDHKIYVYNVTEGYSLVTVITQHQAFISSFDFSDDSMWMRANCGGLELNYFEVETGLYIPAAARLRDVKWNTYQVTLEYNVQGIWSPYYDGVDYLTLDSNVFRQENNGQIIITGDNFGRIQLLRYPCLQSFARRKTYWASSSPCTRVRFGGPGDTHVVSLSGNDKVIFQWKHYRDNNELIAFQTDDRRGLLQEEDDDVSNWVQAIHLHNNFPLNNNNSGVDDSAALVLNPNFMSSMQAELKQLVSHRPWLGSIIEPSNWQPPSALDPFAPCPYNITLQHLLGFQCSLIRNPAVAYAHDQTIAYATSRYLVTYHKKMNSQSIYERHTSDIICFSVSRDGKYIASVEKSQRPTIQIFDAISKQHIVTLPSLFRQGVIHISFHPSGQYLSALGLDTDNSLGLYYSPSGAWTDGYALTWTSADTQQALFLGFNETILPSEPDQLQLFAFSGGRYHIKFWSLQGNVVNPVYAEYGKNIKLNTLLCGTSFQKKVLTGSVSGHLYVWKGRSLDRVIRAHERGITCLSNHLDLYLASTSKDGTLKLWNGDLEQLKSFSLSEADVSPLSSVIRSVDCLQEGNEQLNTLLLSTAAGEMYEAYVLSGKVSLLSEAHFAGELRGLAVHPTNPDVFATTGDDCTIRIWSVRERRLLRKAVIDCTARCCGFSPDGNTLVVGLGGKSDGTRQRKDGAFLVLDGETLKPRYEGRDSRHWITEIKFSPDGKIFALASMDHKIYLYDSVSYKLRGTCDKHNAPVQHIDFSIDGTYIQSDSPSDFDHLYFEAADGQYFSAASQLRDIKWSEWSCIFGWPVQGIWPLMDERGEALSADPASVHRSPNQRMLAVGDQGGRVKIFSFPCLDKKVPRY